jgi:hypothetical protein
MVRGNRWSQKGAEVGTARIAGVERTVLDVLGYVRAMIRSIPVVVALVLGACASTRSYTIQVVNKTPRTIEQLFVFPPGQARGASRAKLAPNAATTLTLQAGAHEIYAISERIVHDDNTRETPEASRTIELRGPLEVVFYDSDAEPPGIKGPNTRGISFKVRPPPGSSDEAEPSVEPAP